MNEAQLWTETDRGAAGRTNATGRAATPGHAAAALILVLRVCEVHCGPGYGARQAGGGATEGVRHSNVWWGWRQSQPCRRDWSLLGDGLGVED